MFTTLSQVSFCNHLSLPFTLFYPFPSSNHHIVVCVYEFFCLIPSPFLSSHHLLTAASLFSVSMSLFLFCLFAYFVIRFHIYVKSYGISLSLTGLLHLAWYPLGPSMLSQKVRFLFLWLNSIPLCKCTTAFLFTHLLMDTWAASKSWLL